MHRLGSLGYHTGPSEPPGRANTAASNMEHTFMMTRDHVGNQEAMVHAQLGQQPLAHTTETPLQPG